MNITPQEYDNWYATPRGRWISDREFALLMKLLHPFPGARLLDLGCGTGHFSRRFARAGLQVTGVDPDPAMLDYARQQPGDIDYLEAEAEALPFADEYFDYSSAVTSLCFVSDPVTALQELWRVSKQGIVLGLLHRHSRLSRQKAGRGAYAGARWDNHSDVLDWLVRAGIAPRKVVQRTAIFFPSGNLLARFAERVLPGRLPRGGFLAVYLDKLARSAD